ncbi:hypothetical protein SELMODRAFT_424019 [Selaginella moellendorffii]|uniref:Pentacotripeptide-repeat region of PRORP domain-containing protein n=1 Tax=Selaginella moellendorffii TaxID=88036 RepID=D8SNJ2_SELML|nr:hypothetical protein SELMODRAFT_424019 [Selaginella moellendorffii]
MLEASSNIVGSQQSFFATLLSQSGGSGDLDQTRKIHSRIVDSGYSKDKPTPSSSASIKVTYTTLLSCCDDLGDGEEIHACVVRDGIEWDVAMSTALGLSSSSKSGFSTGMINTISSRAMEFLCSTGGDVSTRDDLVVATALVKCFGSHRRINEAEEVFERFRLCRFDLVLWNAMVWAYAETSHPEEVLFVLKKMDLEGGKADTFTFATDLTACAASCEHALLQTIFLHDRATSLGLGSDPVVVAAVINSYSKSPRGSGL